MSENHTDGSAVAPAELAAWLRTGRVFTVLDVRDRDEFEAWHIDTPDGEVVQIPHQRFVAARATGTTDDLVPDGSEPILTVCAVGRASAEVAEQLRETGVDARNLAGGMDAWAREYEAVELPVADGTVRQYHRSSSGCLGYLLVSGDEAAVIDPLRVFADRYAADAADLDATLVAAVDTHVHADHVSGVRAVAEATDADIALPDGVEERGIAFAPDRSLGDGDSLAVGDAALETVALPGHTPEAVGFRLVDDEHGDLLFAGDTLFLDAVARPDLAVEAGEVEAMARDLHASLATLRELPTSTRVAPGHVASPTAADDGGRYLATIGELRERHELLSLPESAFVEAVTGSLPERPANDARIIRINLGRETVDDGTAFDLELGPNNCAVR